MTRLPLARRAHPFTLFAAALGTAVFGFLVPGPFGPLLVYAAVALIVVLAGVARAIVRGALICLPLWVLLFVLHAGFGDDSGGTLSVGGLTLSRAGGLIALEQAGRLGAIITASLGMFQAFDAGRLIDAVAAKGWPLHASYLIVGTLQAIPRLGVRADAILEAQRARGLVYRGSLPRRLVALRAVVLPLMLGALAEVDERAIALEMRGVGARGPRTPLDPPRDHLIDRALRWAIAAAVVAAMVWRIAQ